MACISLEIRASAAVVLEEWAVKAVQKEK